MLKQEDIYFSYVYNWRQNHRLRLVQSELANFKVYSDYGEYLGTVKCQSELDNLKAVLRYNRPVQNWWNLKQYTAN